MAISYVGAFAATSYSATRSLSFTLSSSPVENDIIILTVSSSTVATMTDVSGWTNVGGANFEVSPSDTTLTALMLYHRVTAAEDAADTVTWTLTNLWDATESGDYAATTWRGINTTGELCGFNSAADAANAASPWFIPSVTPTANGLVYGLLAGDSTGTLSDPSGWTARSNAGAVQRHSTWSLTAGGVAGVAIGTGQATPNPGDEYVAIVACFAAIPDPIKNGLIVNQQAIRRAANW